LSVFFLLQIVDSHFLESKLLFIMELHVQGWVIEEAQSVGVDFWFFWVDMSCTDSKTTVVKVVSSSLTFLGDLSFMYSNLNSAPKTLGPWFRCHFASKESEKSWFGKRPNLRKSESAQNVVEQSFLPQCFSLKPFNNGDCKCLETLATRCIYLSREVIQFSTIFNM
jgi:hypothetical protein